jgi:hypothetical protein
MDTKTLLQPHKSGVGDTTIAKKTWITNHSGLERGRGEDSEVLSIISQASRLTGASGVQPCLGEYVVAFVHKILALLPD